MSTFSRKLLLIIFIACGNLLIFAQQTQPLGALEVIGRVSIDGKQQKLQRKRFYVLRGGLEENKGLVDKLKAAESVSRDCFYSQMKASPQYICWLKAENCESPYCRKIIEPDIEIVPEFQTAYQKGLRQYGRNRPSIALDWLTTNLPPALRDGFYHRQATLLESLLKNVQPLQSAMTDTISVRAIFIDIPLNLQGPGGQPRESEKFFVSNILPIEIGDKSYVWACETEISPKKQARLILKDCELIVRDLPVCKTESCKK